MRVSLALVAIIFAVAEASGCGGSTPTSSVPPPDGGDDGLAADDGGEGDDSGAGADAFTGPAIVSFAASPMAISQGQGTTLSWVVTQATTLSIDQGVGSVLGPDIPIGRAHPDHDLHTHLEWFHDRAGHSVADRDAPAGDLRSNRRHDDTQG